METLSLPSDNLSLTLVRSDKLSPSAGYLMFLFKDLHMSYDGGPDAFDLA